MQVIANIDRIGQLNWREYVVENLEYGNDEEEL